MTKDKLYSCIKDSANIDASTLPYLNDIVEKYPYFQSACLLRLKNLYLVDKDEFASELAKSSLICADRKQLYFYIMRDRYEKFLSLNEEEYSKKVSADRTDTLLDVFLCNVEEKNKKDKKQPTLIIEQDSLISQDYFTFLNTISPHDETEIENSKEVKPMRHQSVIDSFLEKSNNNELNFTLRVDEADSKKHTSKEDDISAGNDDFLSLTLAKIYIKQKKYKQALAIIKRLSLNFPKKSSYFVDQISFLEKLIINDNNK